MHRGTASNYLSEIPYQSGNLLYDCWSRFAKRPKRDAAEVSDQSCESFEGIAMAQQTEGKPAKFRMWPQWVAGIGVLLLLLQIGIMAGWSSPYVAQLTSGEYIFQITLDEASWVVSLLNLGRLVGAIFGSMCVNYVGSKTTILVTSVPMAFCWIFIMVADEVTWLYASRLCGGISLGMTYSSFSLYLGEIADPSIRGALVSMGMGGLSVGNLVICVMGAYLSMDVSAIVSLVLCVILMCLFVWLPESPHHLARRDATEKAKASLLFYHRDCDVDAEYAALKKFVESSSTQTFLQGLREFKEPAIKKALVLSTMLFMFSQMCGMNNVLFYMETILRQSHVTVLDPAVVVIIVMVFGIVASCLSMILIDRFGRRILMVTSCVAVSISLAGLGMEFQFLQSGYDAAQLEWLPIFSVILFQVAVFIGVLSVPSAILGEIFPPNVKCIAACMGSISAGVFSFISTSTYQPLINIMGQQYVFWFYCLLLLSAVPFTLICLPETKGKSLQEIQKQLIQKK